MRRIAAPSNRHRWNASRGKVAKHDVAPRVCVANCGIKSKGLWIFQRTDALKNRIPTKRAPEFSVDGRLYRPMCNIYVDAQGTEEHARKAVAKTKAKTKPPA